MNYIFLASLNTLAEQVGENLGEIIGSPLLVGLILVLFFTMFAMFLLIPFSALICIEIPLCFLVFEWIPTLRPVVGIMIGILIGLALVKWIRR